MKLCRLIGYSKYYSITLIKKKSPVIFTKLLISRPPHSQIWRCKDWVSLHSGDCVVLQFVPELPFGPHARLNFKSYSGMKGASNRGMSLADCLSTTASITATGSKKLWSMRCSAVFLPVLPTSISVPYLTPTYMCTVPTKVRELMVNSAT